MHFHAYSLNQTEGGDFRLALGRRFSTDSDGIAECLGLKASPKVELKEIVEFLEARVTDDTLLVLR